MKKYLVLILRFAIALLLLNTLFYKFTAHPDSVYLFTKLGIEPYGRIGIGIFELITSILLILPKTVWLGALLSFFLMVGAIFAHLTKLGINVNGDGGAVFYSAVVILILSIILIVIYRKSIPYIKKLF